MIRDSRTKFFPEFFNLRDLSVFRVGIMLCAKIEKCAFTNLQLDNIRITVPNFSILVKGRNKDAVIYLYDAKGKERIRMSVSAEGTPKLEFLDADGKVTYSLPNSSSTPKQ